VFVTGLGEDILNRLHFTAFLKKFFGINFRTKALNKKLWQRDLSIERAWDMFAAGRLELKNFDTGLETMRPACRLDGLVSAKSDVSS
jgi:hypothetical protein